MARNNRGRNNNNPEGRNQYSNGWMDSAKERPYTTAAVAAATVGAGVFLWSRRNQISDQLSGLSEQISDWTSNMSSGSTDGEFETAEAGGTGASMNRGTQARSGNSRSRSSATSGSTGSTAQSGGSGTNRQEPVG